VPLVYVLLPNKQERTYQKMLDIVKEQCLTMGLNLSPAVIMLDFEVSAMDAFRTVWPPFAAVAFMWVRRCTVRSVISVWHRHIKMMQKLGSGWSTCMHSILCFSIIVFCAYVFFAFVLMTRSICAFVSVICAYVYLRSDLRSSMSVLRPSVKTSNNSATRRSIDFVFGSRLRF